jgi:hypothetical protein
MQFGAGIEIVGNGHVDWFLLVQLPSRAFAICAALHDNGISCVDDGCCCPQSFDTVLAICTAVMNCGCIL